MSMYDLTKLPAKVKAFKIELSNKHTHIVDEETKDRIMTSKSQFVQLKDGSVINKAFIVEIGFSEEETRLVLKRLPYDMREKLIRALPQKDEVTFGGEKFLLST